MGETETAMEASLTTTGGGTANTKAMESSTRLKMIPGDEERGEGCDHV